MKKDLKHIEGQIKKMTQYKLSKEKDAVILKALNNANLEEGFHKSLNLNWFTQLILNAKKITAAMAVFALIFTGITFFDSTDSYAYHLDKAKEALEQLEEVAKIDEVELERLVEEALQATENAIEAAEEINDPAKLESALKEIQAFQTQKFITFEQLIAENESEQVQEAFHIALQSTSESWEGIGEGLNELEAAIESGSKMVDLDIQTSSSTDIVTSLDEKEDLSLPLTGQSVVLKAYLASDTPPSQLIQVDQWVNLMKVEMTSKSLTPGLIDEIHFTYQGEGSLNEWGEFRLYYQGKLLSDEAAINPQKQTIHFDKKTKYNNGFTPVIFSPEATFHFVLAGKLKENAPSGKKHQFSIFDADHVGGSLDAKGNFPVKSNIFTVAEKQGIDTPCGNGKVEQNEQCDDGNQVTELCKYGLQTCEICTASCQLISGQGSYCGDGKIQDNQGEQCDDGNNTTESCPYGDENCMVCNASCQETQGQASYCGDGIKQALQGEQCDDGNPFNGDGCSNSCQIEIAEPICGNGLKEQGEQCDDGNAITEDCDYGMGNCVVCSASCKIIEKEELDCGDGILQEAEGEQCDDGNSFNGDGCSNSCQIEEIKQNESCTQNDHPATHLHIERRTPQEASSVGNLPTGQQLVNEGMNRLFEYEIIHTPDLPENNDAYINRLSLQIIMQDSPNALNQEGDEILPAFIDNLKLYKNGADFTNQVSFSETIIQSGVSNIHITFNTPGLIEKGGAHTYVLAGIAHHFYQSNSSYYEIGPGAFGETEMYELDTISTYHETILANGCSPEDAGTMIEGYTHSEGDNLLMLHDLYSNTQPPY